METKEYRTIDKSTWGPGPWQSEPDKRQWKDEATGLPCLIVRGPSGALCGYVGIAEGHPLYKKEYSQSGCFPCSEDCSEDWHYDCEPQSRLRVHGGLTFSDMCSPGATEEKGICHTPGPGEPDHVWWFGFDCAHSGDYSPKFDREYSGSYGEYRDATYVAAECASLARQLAALSEQPSI